MIGEKTIVPVVDALKTQPLVLALVCINVLFLFGGGYTLFNIMEKVSEGQIRRDTMITAIIKDCAVARKE